MSETSRRVLARDVSYATLGETRALAREVEALEAKLAAVREALAVVLRGDPDRRPWPGDRGNAPGHAHQIAGVWDDDNGDRAGTPCEWCAAWHAALAILDGEPAREPSNSARLADLRKKDTVSPCTALPGVYTRGHEDDTRSPGTAGRR